MTTNLQKILGSVARLAGPTVLLQKSGEKVYIRAGLEPLVLGDGSDGSE